MKIIVTILLLISYHSLYACGEEFSPEEVCLIIGGPNNIKNKKGIFKGTLKEHTNLSTVAQYLSEPVHNVPFMHYLKYLTSESKPTIENIPLEFHGECWYVEVNHNGYYVHPSWLQKIYE